MRFRRGRPAERVADDDGSAILARTAEFGDYFALPPLDGSSESGALPFEPAAVVDLVNRTRSAIAASANCDRDDVPLRVAASSFQLAVVARLISPVIGAAIAFGSVPLLTPGSVVWQDTGRHVPRFRTIGLTRVRSAEPAQLAALISESLLASVIRPLGETLMATSSLSTIISAGNTISAANGAVTVLSTSRPECERPGRALVSALLDTEFMASTGHFVGGTFRRRNCCLYYQAPGGGLCQDCVLVGSGR